MQLVDAHCHFDFPEFDGIRDQVLAEARGRGVEALVIPGVRRADWARVQALASPDRGLWICLGIHPWFVGEHSEQDLIVLEAQLADLPEGCVALGECGLDALHGELAAQLPWFQAQVDIAARVKLPLVIHSVRSHDEVHGLLRSSGWSGRALVHGFSGSYQQARKLVDLGCYIGVGGVITHDRARKTRDAIARLPVEALVIETDAPDMAPAGVAKGQNSPIYLPRVLQALAELRAESAETLSEALYDNVRQLYGWC
ncbi:MULTISPECIES: TatD family hydrolase [Marinobacter]|jgi:TatD DNase family protein|uniref:TatD family hydrolase n=2 Tax=Marinobacter TaxID=2742 RepID=A0ABV4WDF2_9GAMM|nr:MULTISPECIES: TatD family hydrolase [Marinobacter]AMQ89985.1 hydrolase TatD [Marinobacter sp. LQ44]KXO07895.1 putative deoxyribonuclease YjjV [Marinobacter excellens LAMA 842]MCD1630087.1 TatD family hydrolase [Marinobacter shengliensis]WBU42073.1 TatD family hydrolase [Marinobacter alkaliphilus]|tara:strand:- start:177 stop:944 length:768 start_codon:yes stop_codon:yes gene_type:complete